jgi:hypothetical protein
VIKSIKYQNIKTHYENMIEKTTEPIFVECFFHLIGIKYQTYSPETIESKLDKILDNLNDVYNNDFNDNNWINHPRFDCLSEQTKNNMQSYLTDIKDMIDKPNIKFYRNNDNYYKIYDVGKNKYQLSSNKLCTELIDKNQLEPHTNKLNIIFLSKLNMKNISKLKAGITGKLNYIGKPIVSLNGIKFNRPYSYTLAHEIGHVFGLKHPFSSTHTDLEDIFPEFVSNLDKKTFANPFININTFDPSKQLYGNIMDYHDMVCFWTKNQVKHMREVAKNIFFNKN